MGRLWNFWKDPKYILEMTERFDEALGLVNVPLRLASQPQPQLADQPAQLDPNQTQTIVTVRNVSDQFHVVADPRMS